MPDAQFELTLRSLEQREVALVRAVLARPELLDARSEASLRHALSTARLYRVAGLDGEVDVEEAVAPLRAEVIKLLDVAGLTERVAPSLSPEKLRPVAAILREQALRTRDLVARRYAPRLTAAELDAEIRNKVLAVAAGGGGGVGYIYLGAFKLLEDHGLRPALIAGTSMGAILGLFRARANRYDTGAIAAVVRSLSWGKLFETFSIGSRYGLPAALRLYLRPSIGKLFRKPDGGQMALSDLPIPLICTVSGIRTGVLPRPLEFYERLLDDVRRSPTPFLVGRKIPAVVGALVELVQLSERLETIYLGLDEGTEQFDAIDAVGFSAALPGVVHYDVDRADDRVHRMIGDLFARRELFRMADGCLVDNVPARAAWRGVHRGLAKTRNVFILAMDAFAPKLTTPVWLAMQSIVSGQVQRSCEWAHLYKSFRGTLSPLELVPKIPATFKMLDRGKRELEPEMAFIGRMLQPLPPLD